MPPESGTTQTINSTSVEQSTITELRKRLTGKVLTQGDNGYNDARALWNSMIDRKPTYIVQCSKTQDVVTAIEFARQRKMIVSVKGGGHNVAGNAACDNGVMIDLSQMKKISVDTVKKTATAEAGVIWKEFDQATQQYGLATTGGTVSETGIAGLTLGGGIGWLMSQYGTSSDNLLAAEVVTATGEIIKTDKNNHPELFWAIRGGGGNFGVVTSFTYQLHEVGPMVTGGMLLYPMDMAKKVMQFYREFTKTTPDQLVIFAGYINTPEGLPVCVLLPAWFGAQNIAEKMLEPIRSFATPIADLVSLMPYTQLQTFLDAAAPKGIRRYWKSGFFSELSDELLDIHLKYVESRPNPISPVLLFHLKGEITRIDPAATAFSIRRNLWDFDIVTQWTDAAEDEKNIEWTRNFWKTVEPFSQGVYVNHLDSDDHDRLSTAYGKNYERLRNIKTKYDPLNFFRMNNNILPE
jgi:FAD/FMN-containing dehydrogenase